MGAVEPVDARSGRHRRGVIGDSFPQHLVEMELETANAQVELSDRETLADDVPEWDGRSPVAATARAGIDFNLIR